MFVSVYVCVPCFDLLDSSGPVAFHQIQTLFCFEFVAEKCNVIVSHRSGETPGSLIADLVRGLFERSGKCSHVIALGSMWALFSFSF